MMKLITYGPNTFLPLYSAKPSFALNSKIFITVISVNNIYNLLVKFGSEAFNKNLQKSFGLFNLKNKIAHISKDIQRFILVGWIDRP